jgi:hypothetical protein
VIPQLQRKAQLRYDPGYDLPYSHVYLATGKAQARDSPRAMVETPRPGFGSSNAARGQDDAWTTELAVPIDVRVAWARDQGFTGIGRGGGRRGEQGIACFLLAERRRSDLQEMLDSQP